ncbi:response regulator [Duganella sp. LX20W]|uniref:Response regulator n=1 Tax=Rugamonas brunnea TaxID=2758569 RepID=A0A7W2IA45_9BURK|nr:response regulator [Rugamonas brunnea]MBA5635517.1 response regulator [Rugamonas brunnea]
MKLPDRVVPPAPDWSPTRLGEAAHWPPALRLVIDILLNSPAPMLLMWSREQIMVYNEAYVSLNGSTSLQAPGGKVPPVLPPAWSWNAAAIEHAWAGHSASYRAQPLSVWRKGMPTQLPCDLYYTPVRDAAGAVAGILCMLMPATVPAGSIATTAPLRILVVEDNADARYLACETLRALGHHVHAVASAEAALPALEQDPVDILFCDVSLPGMSGVELARLALDSHPGLQLLFVSGYGDALTRHLPWPVTTLQKPYELEQLQQALSSISRRLHDDAP